MTARKTMQPVLAELAKIGTEGTWSRRKAGFVKGLFVQHEFYYLGDLVEWLDKQYFYGAQEAAPEERAKARRAYRLVFGKPYAPETFAHRALSSSPELMRQLTHAFGSRRELNKCVRKGEPLGLEGAYAAALFGFLPMERVQDYAPRGKRLK